jgi:hypothetical protein
MIRHSRSEWSNLDLRTTELFLASMKRGIAATGMEAEGRDET